VILILKQKKFQLKHSHKLKNTCKDLKILKKIIRKNKKMLNKKNNKKLNKKHNDYNQISL
jgi:hypothetical protein